MVINGAGSSSPDTFHDITGGMSSNHNSRFSGRKQVYAKARKELPSQNLLHKFEEEEPKPDLNSHIDKFMDVKEVSFANFTISKLSS